MPHCFSGVWLIKTHRQTSPRRLLMGAEFKFRKRDARPSYIIRVKSQMNYFGCADYFGSGVFYVFIKKKFFQQNFYNKKFFFNKIFFNKNFFQQKNYFSFNNFVLNFIIYSLNDIKNMFRV